MQTDRNQARLPEKYYRKRIKDVEPGAVGWIDSISTIQVDDEGYVWVYGLGTFYTEKLDGYAQVVFVRRINGDFVIDLSASTHGHGGWDARDLDDLPYDYVEALLPVAEIV